MYHEHHTSKLYTATSLGEILSQRIWTSFNTINTNRKKDASEASEKKLVIDDRNNIAEKAQEDWDVRGQWMLIDAIEAITMGLDSSQVRRRDRGQSVRRLVHQACS